MYKINSQNSSSGVIHANTYSIEASDNSRLKSTFLNRKIKKDALNEDFLHKKGNEPEASILTNNRYDILESNNQKYAKEAVNSATLSSVASVDNEKLVLDRNVNYEQKNAKESSDLWAMIEDDNSNSFFNLDFFSDNKERDYFF